MNIGKTIKISRTQKELTQTDLAKIAGISASYLSLIEKGRRDPNIALVKKISEALGIPFCIFIFFASGDDEKIGLTESLLEKLSVITLGFMKPDEENLAKSPTKGV